ncbi:MAG: hypothetical protein K1X67_09675 [Fimbriimonadaceae bacterium]|nr:hypothetical protein [Fimbriimonadaceae bacterium]
MTTFRFRCRTHELDIASCLTAGQTFRWGRDGESFWLSDGALVYHLRQDESGVDVSTTGSRADFDFLFDLDRDYQQVRESILDAAPELADSLRPLTGLRLMRQSSPVEVLFAFLCTQNNHLARIHQMVDRLVSLPRGAAVPPALAGIAEETEASHARLDMPRGRIGSREIEGQAIAFEDGASAGGTAAPLWGEFPPLNILASQAEGFFRDLGFGYRARSVVGAAQMALSLGGEAWLESLRQASYENAHGALTQLPGIGPKVADCVCLYGLHHMRAVPVDVHIWNAAVDRYFPEWREKSLTPQRYQAIAGLFRDKFGDLAGHAQQMVFVDRLRRPRKAKAKRD